MPETSELHLAVALDGAGWHPAAWRAPDARPGELFSAGYWADLAREAEAGALDFLTIEDSLGLQTAGRFASPDDRTDQVRGRLDAVLTAARIAPHTTRIGLVPTAVTTHTEPFHLSTSIATLDYVSEGRAGWRPRVAASPDEARHFGRREFPPLTQENVTDPAVAAHLSDLFDEAADAVPGRAAAVGLLGGRRGDPRRAGRRFVDRGKLHYIDFDGRWFAVRGPSITPRPPQGQPVVASLAHADVAYRLAARASDVVFVTPSSAEHAAQIVAEVRAAENYSERPLPPLQVYADLVVFIDEAPGAAEARKRRLDDLDGADFATDCAVVAGPPGELADRLLDWKQAAGLDGFRLRPGALPHDLQQITRALVPELRRRGAFRSGYAESTLRERLGLSRPANRYGASRYQIGAA